MDDKLYFTILSAAIAVYGLYVIYVWLKLKLDNYLFYNQLLIPSGYAARDCKRPGEYIRYIKPRLLIFGLVIAVSGILDVLCIQFFSMDTWLFWTLIIVPMAVIVWFVATLIIVRRRFWED